MLILEALVGKTLDMTTLDGRDIAIQVTDIVKPAYELVDSLMKLCVEKAGKWMHAPQTSETAKANPAVPIFHE
ncbi:hypothetical protein P8452_75253 [Trifolium repens]|nr:hypothetical protein P8452_75253 [Trifolium repens]